MSLRTEIKNCFEKKILGINIKNWSLLLCFFIALYIVLSTIYISMLHSAIRIRYNQWLELPKNDFGEFEKNTEYVVDFSSSEFYRVPVDIDNLDLYRVLEDWEYRTYNRPNGCIVDESEDLYICEGNHWHLPPWIIDMAADHGMPGCSKLDELNVYGSLFNLNDGYDVDKLCLSGIINNKII